MIKSANASTHHLRMANRQATQATNTIGNKTYKLARPNEQATRRWTDRAMHLPTAGRSNTFPPIHADQEASLETNRAARHASE